MADDLLQPLFVDLAQAVALELVVEPGVERIDVGRQLALAPEVVPGILEGREDVLVREPEARGDARQQPLRMRLVGLIVPVLVGEQLRMRPHRLAVLAPEEIQRPARQLLAGIPLALAEVQQAALAVLQAQLVHQVGAEQPFRRAHGSGVPLGAVAVVDRHEGRLAALRQPHVVAQQVGVDLMAERLDRLPLLVAVGQRHPRRLPDAGDLHVVLEGRLAFVERARDRRRRRRIGRTGQRYVAFAGEQPRGRVEADPAGAGQEHLAPGMQVGEVDLGARRAVERFHVALELDQVARDEARREAEVARQLHQQPAAVAAGTAAVDQRDLGRLHARLHADQVGDVALQALVERDQEIGRLHRLARNARQVFGELRRQRRLLHVGRELVRLLGLVLEREVLGRRLQEEVERIEHRHLGHQVDLDAHLGRRVGEHQPRQVVRLRILLPVDEMLGRLDAHRVRQDARPRVRCRAQPHDLRPEVDRPVVAVVGDVIERDMDRHARDSGGGSCGIGRSGRRAAADRRWNCGGRTAPLRRRPERGSRG